MKSPLPITTSPKLPLIRKLLVVGDSITFHGPSIELNWFGNWGMAASSQANDYVHRFVAKMTEQQGTEPELLIMAEGGGTLAGQLKQIHRMVAFEPDVAVIQMGENDRDISPTGFLEPYEKIIRAIRLGNPSAIIFCLGTWGPPRGCPEKDALIRNACRSSEAIFVDISWINNDPDTSASSEKRFSHAGVNWHPGDKGMASYAEALWQALLAPERADRSSIPVLFSDQIILKELWDGISRFDWDVAPDVDPNLHVARFGSEQDERSSFATAPLPIELLRGSWVSINTTIKSASPSLSGVELSLHLVDAEAKSEMYQAVAECEAADWSPLSLRLRIPENTVSAKLRIGSKNQFEAVCYQSISISANNTPGVGAL